MFGLEKSPREKFDFDLEVDLKDNPKKAKELMNTIEGNINKIKKKLKSGGSKEELNKLGTLLQGYTALVKVLKKSQKT
ncbi:MAG: hypothetical protein K940chlam5_00145 [Candidatus Anoxychlamydiales bacterium]|nr:hypothetical protein [Candidatus Anoxychlamydiales bacterium]NGX48557.1 hypothetical protein [Candidatus Anoxychlamydiales bacterium]NGX52740.1 hypothetical protein [Candidatus Anoxychlamydiales bacterium]